MKRILIFIFILPLLIYCVIFWINILLPRFHKMDSSINQPSKIKKTHTDTRYEKFAMRAENNPEKTEKWYSHAQSLRKESAKLVAIIDEIRQTFVDISGLDEGGVLNLKDDKELVINMLVKEDGEKGALGYGKKLKDAREKYKAFLFSLDSLEIYEGPDSMMKHEISMLFNTDDFDEDGDGPKSPVKWAKAKYYQHVPQAVMAFMAQEKLDIGNIEGSILELLDKAAGNH